MTAEPGRTETSHSNSRKIGLRLICTEYSIFTKKTVYKERSPNAKVLLWVIKYGRGIKNILTVQKKQLMTIFKFRTFAGIQEKELKKRQAVVGETQ